jgi:uncharacterized protein YjbJ (UPF0337 family)
VDALRGYPVPWFENTCFQFAKQGTRAATKGDGMGDRTQQAKGKAQELKGKTKESVGRGGGKLSTERKGTADVAKGKANQGAAKAKRALKN